MDDRSSMEFKGGRIAFTSSGVGKTIVFLHGFLETKEIWTELVNYFSVNYRIVTVDLPGHGKSSSFGYSHSMDFMAQSVRAVLKHLKVRKIKIVGHSLGGYVGIAFADKFPDNIGGLCLFHSTVSDDPPQKKKEREKLIRLVQRNKELFVREAIPNLFNTNIKPYSALIAKQIKIAMGTSIQGIIAALEGMKNRPNRELLLKFLPFPILYVVGRHDNILPVNKLLDECSLADHIQYEILEDSGHMGFIEEREKTREILKKFLRKV